MELSLTSETSMIANCIPLEAGSSTGKTEIIKKLRAEGFNCIDEVTTPIIAGGITPAIGREPFQRLILDAQLAAESAVRGCDGIWFLDRGLLIGRAHFVDENLPIPDWYDQLDVSHYAHAFIIEPVGIFEKNGIRPARENLAWSTRMTDLVEAEYRRRGIGTTRIGPMPDKTVELSVEKRVASIIEHCKRLIPDFAARSRTAACAS